MTPEGWSSQRVKKRQIDAILIMCSMVRLGQTLLTSKDRIDKDSFDRITLWLRMLVDPIAAEGTRKALLHDCSKSFEAMLQERKMIASPDSAVLEDLDTKQQEVVTQPDSLITFRQLRENRLLGAKEVDLDETQKRILNISGLRTPFSCPLGANMNSCALESKKKYLGPRPPSECLSRSKT